jgi:mannose-6-phosphate isomerase-like protein (cupin superfamily)
MSTDPVVVRRREARSFLEGQEHCREYFATDSMTFGTSSILPGQEGAADPGHPGALEVFFVARGHVLCSLGNPANYYELEEGDALLIPEGEPHSLANVGEVSALVVWAGAPT